MGRPVPLATAGLAMVWPSGLRATGGEGGGSLKITPELMAFGGERIYFRDIEAVERGLPDRANQTFRVEVRTREGVHRLDLMAYRIYPESSARPAEELQRR